MTEYIYEAYRTFEGEITNREFSTSLEHAKVLARNMVVLESPPNWISNGHWRWKLEDYGERNENLHIEKHMLKGDIDELEEVSDE